MHHHHRDNHHPVRRSPRLSLSPPPKKQTTKPPLALALLHQPISLTDDPDPKPLNVYHPTQTKIKTQAKTLLLPSVSSKKTIRRSPRLLAASIGVTNKQCGSSSTTLLLKLSDSSEKKACELARSCLDDTDFRVKCLRSRKLPLPSPLSAPHAKRKLESDRYSHESPVTERVTRRSPRLSGDSSSCTAGKREKSAKSLENVPLALPCASLTEHSSGKAVNGKVTRRSPRFSGDSSPCAELIAGEGFKSARKSENVPLTLLCSSAARNSSEKTVNGRVTRRSPRLSGDSLEIKELNGESEKSIAGKRGKPAGNSKKAPLALPWFSPAGNSLEKNVNREFRRHSPRFTGNSPESKELNGESEELVAGKRGKSACNLKKAPLALPWSSSAGNSSKKNVNRESRRHSPRFTGNSPESKELNGESEELDAGKRGKSASNLKKAPLALPWSHQSSPRFCGPKSGKIEGRKELKGEIEEQKEKKFEEVVKSSMAEKLGEDMEEKVLRRSPRALASISLVDYYECEEMKELSSSPKKKKKKEEKKKTAATERREKNEEGKGMVRKKSENCYFVGEVVPEEEAHQRWGWRYQLQNRRFKRGSFTTNAEEEDEPILKVKCHYTQAQINGCTFHLEDCALIRGEGREKHIGRIMEFFQTVDGEDYFRVQWFYKAEDTVMKENASFHDKKRIFYSTIMNDNLLDCIISKLNVAQVTPQLNLNSSSIPPSDFYYDMEYCLEYSTFRNLPRDNCAKSYELSSVSCPGPDLSLTNALISEDISICEPCNAQLTMLDLYAGCGAMSTGLCIGSRLSGVNLVTRWAIDCDSFACESLRLNHPETRVRNEEAEDFLELLKQWEKLCDKYVNGDGKVTFTSMVDDSDKAESSSDAQSDNDATADELEVLSLIDICYGDIDATGKRGLKFKVRWKGYGPDEDTWEPIEGLSNCQELIQNFILNGFNSKILPLPGDVDVICGGPPCQGISGYNRFRCVDSPFTDERNRQLVVFMDIVEYLKPKFVLMENVTDILRFDKASLGRYALSRLVHMNYQARIGIMAAGCYGLPQFRLRVFFWGALPSEELPQFPLPTHDVVVRHWPPPEFERNVVAYEEGQPPELEDAVFLRDAISDLPAVTNYESSDEMLYTGPPENELQKYIRSTKHGSASRPEEDVLYDHRPHQLFEDDYIRVCQIPHKKGANFRDLPGIIVGDDNVVQRDPTKAPVRLPSGMPMVPEYAFTFEHGKSKRPFARLWWDETMPTVVTYPNCHSQAVLHPEQDRVLTVRECARLQGFPDNYRLCGTVKRRYRQVGNAVAIPVAKALGYSLGMAFQKLTGEGPLITLPPNFVYS